MPHKTIDLIAIGAQIVTNLQLIASRSANPLEIGGRLGHQVQRRQRVQCQLPTTPASPAPCARSIRRSATSPSGASRQIVSGIAASHDAEADIRLHRNYPVTVNHADETGACRSPPRATSPATTNVDPRRRSDDGRRGFLLHAERAPRRLHLRRQRRHRRPAQSGLRLQRRSDRPRHLLLGPAAPSSAWTPEAPPHFRAPGVMAHARSAKQIRPETGKGLGFRPCAFVWINLSGPVAQQDRASDPDPRVTRSNRVRITNTTYLLPETITAAFASMPRSKLQTSVDHEDGNRIRLRVSLPRRLPT